MKLFKRKEKEKQQTNQIQGLMKDLQTASFRDIISASLGVTRLNQKGFEQTVLSNLDWRVDMKRQIILFGDRHYKIQFVGSESHISHTWKWAWDNVNGFPESLFAYALAVKNLFKEKYDFTHSDLPLSNLVNGNTLASVCSCVFAEKLLPYPCKYDSGVAYVLIKGLESDVFARAKTEVVVKTIMEIINEVSVNAYLLTKAIFLTHGKELVDEGNLLRAQMVDKVVLEAKFDERNRLVSLDAVS